MSEAESPQAARMLLDLGIDPNEVSDEGRTALHGAAHKGRDEVVQLLVDRGARLDQLDFGSRETRNGDMLGHRWIALNYAEGLVRVGVQSAIPHPKTAALLRKLMADRGLAVPPPTTSSICITQICNGNAKQDTCSSAEHLSPHVQAACFPGLQNMGWTNSPRL